MYRIPEEVKQFVRDHAAGTYNSDLARMLNERFGTDYRAQSVANLKSYLGVRSGLVTTFQKGKHASRGTEYRPGHVPWTKGKKGLVCGGHTKFKPGHRPANYMPVGTVAKNTDGYWRVKLADPNVWAFKHRLLWEEAHGPIPDDMVVMFLDGNKDNCTLDNLAMVKRTVHCRINNNGLRGDTPELGRAGILTAELITALAERRRR
jgi:hypothetical protein